jgi:ligand-binding sensor domain-containing protein/signal transduction histidine kinase
MPAARPTGLVVLAGILALGLSSAHPTRAEAQNVRFTRLGLEDGLIQASVYSLAQDTEGFLWVGTQNGLNRYDGRSFFSSWSEQGQPSPLSFGYIRALLVDALGDLWAGVDSYGLFRFDRTTDEFHRVPVLLPDGSAPATTDTFRTWTAAQLGDDVVVGTSVGLGYVRHSEQGPVLELLPSAEVDDCGHAISTLWAPSPHDLWIGTPDGCLRRWRPGPQALEALAEPGGVIHFIAQGRGDTVWVASEPNGLSAFERSGRTLSQPRRGSALPLTARVQAMLTMPESDTWIGTRSGLGRVPAGQADTIWFTMGSAEDGGLPQDHVTALLEDRSGVLWVGTWNGLARLSPFYRGIGFIPKPSVPGEEPLGGIVAIREVSDGLLLGALGGRLALVSRGRDRAAFITGAPAFSDVFSIALGPEGEWWIATRGSGVHRRTGDGWRSYREGVEGPGGAPEDLVASIFVDRSGTVWAGTLNRGLAVYDPEQDLFREFRGPDGDFRYAADYIWPIVEDRAGALWFGADGNMGGLHRLSPDRRELATFATRTPQTPNGGRILTVYLSGDTIIWFGTQGAGLGRLDATTGAIGFYTSDDGLPHNSVQGILEDDAGFLWVTTNEGMARFNPERESFWVFREDSGIQANRFFANSARKGKDGLLYFGGPNGVTVVDPAQMVPRDAPPPVVLTGFSVRGTARPGINNATARTGIQLGPRENFFAFEFSALDFTEASLNSYRYMLEGLDRAWIEGGDTRSANYTSVPPDRYTFRVQARSSEGAWNRQGLSIPLIVHPPFYATWWFRLLVVMAVGSMLWAAYSYRMRQLLRVERMRLDVAGDLHDDIGANLSAIALKTELVRDRAQQGSDDQQRLTDVERLARDTVRSVREMIWVVNSDNDTLRGLMDRLEETAAAMLQGVLKYDLHFRVDEPDRPVGMELRQDVHLLFKEMLQNVIKHADATNVHVEFTELGDRLELEVSDDGRGFDPRRVTPGNGSKLMLHRATKHKGLFEIVPRDGPGTTARLSGLKIR